MLTRRAMFTRLAQAVGFIVVAPTVVHSQVPVVPTVEPSVFVPKPAAMYGGDSYTFFRSEDTVLRGQFVSLVDALTIHAHRGDERVIGVAAANCAAGQNVWVCRTPNDPDRFAVVVKHNRDQRMWEARYRQAWS